MPPPKYDVDILIVGAGIAGAGLACAMAPYGLRILLLEKRRRMGSIHRGDSLVPKNTALLAKWGILQAFEKNGGQKIHHMEMHHNRYGRIYRAPLLGPDSTPYLVLPHAQIEQTLLQQALVSDQVQLVQPAKLTGLLRTTTNGRVRGVTYRDSAGEHTAHARLVVGADGQHSLVRSYLGINTKIYHYKHAYFGLEAKRPANYSNVMRIHLHAEGGVLIMPHPERVGLGVLVEAGSGAFWMKQSDRQLAATLSRRAPILTGMPLYREGSHVYALTRSHAPQYCRQGAVIIGDAAHTTNPTAGQGMAMALTDAGRLAETIGEVLRQGSEAHTLDTALATYEDRQRPANGRLVRSSHLLALLYAGRGGLLHGLKTACVRALANPVAVRMVSPIIASFLQSER